MLGGGGRYKPDQDQPPVAAISRGIKIVSRRPTMPARTRRALAKILIVSVALTLPMAARAQDAFSSESNVGALRVSVSPQQAQQIISERLLQDGIAAGFQALRQQLNLTPAQQPKWRDFILASTAMPTADVLATVSADDATPLGQARIGLGVRKKQLQLETRRVKAMARLYRSLDGNQRNTFDQGVAMIASLSVSGPTAN
jgi:hypothetical protein